MAGCGEQGGDGAGPTSSPVPPALPPTVIPELPVLPPPTRPPKEPTDLVPPVTLTGRILETTPAGCVRLRTDLRQLFLLVGIDPDEVRAGERVEVTGRPAPQLRGVCTGTVLRVRDWRALPS